MKAKEYTQEILPLLREDSPDSNARYHVLVNQLFNECIAIASERLKHIDASRDSPQFSQMLATAYDEGHRKWKAVFHALSVKRGSPPPAPFYETGIYIEPLKGNIKRLENGEFTLAEFRTASEVIHQMVCKSGAQNCPLYRQIQSRYQELVAEEASAVAVDVAAAE